MDNKGHSVAAFDGTLSSDGQTVAFFSAAPDITDNSPAGFQYSLYIRNLTTGVTRLLFSGGPEGNVRGLSLSADGRVATFAYAVRRRAGYQWRLMAVNTGTGDIKQVLPGHGRVGMPSLDAPMVSADGTSVVFASADPTLAPGDTNGVSDVFETTMSGKVTLVSAGKNGVPGDGQSSGPSVSASGRYVAFVSSASNLVDGRRTHGHVDGFVRDLQTHKTTQVDDELDVTTGNGKPYSKVVVSDIQISADGGRVAYLYKPDSWYSPRVGLRDLSAAEPITVMAYPEYYVMSADGRTLTYGTKVGGGYDDAAFQIDLATLLRRSAITPLRALNQRAFFVPLAASADGRYVLFYTNSRNVTPIGSRGDVPTLVRSDLPAS